MKKILSYFWHRKKISAVLIVVIALVIFLLLPKNGGQIETQKVKRQNITESVTTSGKVESKIIATLNFLTSGKLVYIGAKEGDFVKAGQTIAALDARSVQKNLEGTLRNYQIQRNVFDATKQNNQNRTPKSALSEDMKRILENNQYDLEKAVISVELQSLAREQSYLVSPIDGIIIRADKVLPGENVGVTNTYIIVNQDDIIFNIEVDEADIGKISLGTSVKVTLESFPNQTINLTVTKIDFTSHTSTNGGNVFNVEAKLPDNTGYKYRLGMTGDAEIVVSQKPHALIIPIESIANDTYVYVKKGASFEKRKVTLGIQSDTDREVIVGLKEGEEVAVSPDEAAKLQNTQKRFLFF